jgi:hypothetical protein
MNLRQSTAEWWQERGHDQTFSWLYEPLIADAFGMTNVFTFQRPPGWDTLVHAYAVVFQQHGLQWATLMRDGVNHISADQQNALIDMDPVMSAAASEYGIAVRARVVTGNGDVDSIQNYIAAAAAVLVHAPPHG